MPLVELGFTVRDKLKEGDCNVRYSGKYLICKKKKNNWTHGENVQVTC